MSDDALRVKVRISTRAAIVAGRTAIGAATVTITEADLAGLPEHLREELATVIESGETVVSDDPPIVEATMASLIPVLDARAGDRVCAAIARQAAADQATEEARARAEAEAARDAERSEALRAWVAEHGDDDQKARAAEGFLSEPEILEAVAAELIDAPGFEPYSRLYKGDACDCPCAGHVVFKSRPPSVLDSRQYARLAEIRELIGDEARVAPIEHVAACPACKCVPLARIAARVTMPWKGWLLVRNFAI